MRVSLIVTVALATACGGGEVAPSTTTSPETTSTAAVTTDAPTVEETTPKAAVTTTQLDVAVSETVTEAPMEPTFTSAVHEIGPEIAARMAKSWREGCPVGLEDLRLIELAHFDLEGEVQDGEIVVHADQADAVVAIFERLFELQYPIEQMRLVDEFEADDDLSMEANNTSGFNCRFVGGTTRWSEHAFGRAIDVNPLINPYIRGSRVSPAEGAAYVDRDQDVPGLIKADDAVVQAFSDNGWLWGGYWTGSKDYQHFSVTGR